MRHADLLVRARKQVRENEEATRPRVLGYIEARDRADRRSNGPVMRFLRKWGRAVGALLCLSAAAVVGWHLTGFFLRLSASATLAFYAWGFGFICGALAAMASVAIQMAWSAKVDPALRAALSDDADWVRTARKGA